GIPVGNPHRTHDIIPRIRASLACSAVVTVGSGRAGGMPWPGDNGGTPWGGGICPAGANTFPQLLQNLAPGGLAAPHLPQVIAPPRCVASADRVLSSLWAVEIAACPALWAKCLAMSHQGGGKISARPRRSR